MERIIKNACRLSRWNGNNELKNILLFLFQNETNAKWMGDCMHSTLADDNASVLRATWASFKCYKIVWHRNWGKMISLLHFIFKWHFIVCQCHCLCVWARISFSNVPLNRVDQMVKSRKWNQLNASLTFKLVHYLSWWNSFHCRRISSCSTSF